MSSLALCSGRQSRSSEYQASGGLQWIPLTNDILAVIMGGGRGARLYPLTKMRSKPPCRSPVNIA